jgi:hypothetical protein
VRRIEGTYSVYFIKKNLATRGASACAYGLEALHERSHLSKFDSAESFDPELTTEGLVADCGSLYGHTDSHASTPYMKHLF